MTARRTGHAAWIALSWALGLAALILWVVYPGFMSYDSLHALREARTQVQGGAYPPFVSYVWRAVDAVVPGPAGMLLLQNAVLLGALAAFFVLAGFGAPGAVLGVTVVALAPPLLGSMLVVWKDVAMSASFAAAAALLLMLHSGAGRARRLGLVAALALVFFGTAFRLNAAPAAVPLLVWAVLIISPPGTGGRVWAGRAVLGGGLLSLLLAGVFVLNHYRLPDFSRLAPNPSLRSLQVFDLAGITAISGRVTFDLPHVDGAEAIVSEARQIYDPRHMNLTLQPHAGGFFAGYLLDAPSQEVARAWRGALARAPLAYLTHRWAVFSELIGWTARPVFYPTHGGIDANEFGYTQRSTMLSSKVVAAVVAACGPEPFASLGCRVWLYQAAGLAAMLVCAWVGTPALRAAAWATGASGLAYLLPQFLIAPAADLRYAEWAVVAALLACIAALGAVVGRWWPARRASAQAAAERSGGAGPDHTP